MNDVNFTLPFGEPGEAFVAPGDGPTHCYDLAQCQDSGAVTCGAPVDVVKDWDTLALTGDTTVWCRPDSGPGWQDWALKYADDIGRSSTYIAAACAKAGAAWCTAGAGLVALGGVAAYAAASCDSIWDDSSECVTATRDAALDLASVALSAAAPAAGIPRLAAYFGALWQAFVDLFQPGLPGDPSTGNDSLSYRPYSPSAEMGGDGCAP